MLNQNRQGWNEGALGRQEPRWNTWLSLGARERSLPVSGNSKYKDQGRVTLRLSKEASGEEVEAERSGALRTLARTWTCTLGETGAMEILSRGGTLVFTGSLCLRHRKWIVGDRAEVGSPVRKAMVSGMGW